MPVPVSTIIDRTRNMTNSISAGRLEDSDIREYINNFFRFSRRRYLLPWSERISELLVFPRVYQYGSPTDMVAPKEPQLQLSSAQDDISNFHTSTQKEFARNLNNQNDFAVTWIRGAKFLNIRHKNQDTIGEIVAHTMDSVTANGTWQVGSDGSNLVADTGIFYEGAASLRFDVTNSANLVTLTNSTLTALNLAQSTSTVAGTDFEQNSYVFYWLYIPAGATLTNATLRWGSDSSNYWQGTAATTQFDGQAFTAGQRNLLAFDWRTAAQTGTVDETAINHLQVRLTGASTANRWRVDHIVFRKWTVFDLHYYSMQLAQAVSGGTFKELVTANDDDVLGDEDFIECCTYWVVRDSAKYKLKDVDLINSVTPELQEALKNLARRYPSQEARVSTSYFDMSLLRG